MRGERIAMLGMFIFLHGRTAHRHVLTGPLFSMYQLAALMRRLRPCLIP